MQFQSIDALGGTLAGLNVGTQKSYGLEFALQGGDFSRDGLAYLLSYTHTTNRITFHPINGISVIDSLNGPIEQYNSYTAACANVTPSSANWAACGSGKYAGNAQPGFTNSCGRHCTVDVKNPYYCPTLSSSCPYALQPLFDVNGSYAPYDVIPSPFNAANGFDVPDVLALVVNYRHGRYAVTPSVHWSSGSVYGSPLVWPGYVPQACKRDPASTPQTPGAFCGSGGALFIPDPYNGNHFDQLGQYSQPSQLTLNLSTSYDVSNRLTIDVSAVNIYNKCFQRGYAWDNPLTCVYSSLPSNILGIGRQLLEDSARSGALSVRDVLQYHRSRNVVNDPTI